MNNRLYDIGDLIWRSIRENRTPLTDALIRIIVILAVSMCVIWLLEGLFALLQKHTGRNEADRTAVHFIFTMIRYVVLIISLIILLRSCITEISYGESSDLRDMVTWLHANTVSVPHYLIKLLVALVIFILFNAFQNGLFKVIRRRLDAKGVKESFSHLVLNLVKYILLSFLVIGTIFQMIITDGKNLFALAAYTYICILIAVPTREIRSLLTQKSHTMEVLIPLMGRITVVIVLVALGFGVYAGVQYFLKSGGRDISPYLTMSDEELANQLKTTFMDTPDLGKNLSLHSSYHITVKTDGELNLLYYDGKYLGVNTTERAYQIFGVAVNQPEITAVHGMLYGYDGSMREVSDFAGGASDSHYYYNRIRNDCLVLTVNVSSNRVVSVSYYNDWKLIQSTVTLTEE